ncbi:P-loop containing nucleoside triphosphate hydrolase protein [Pisolithus croceorrhizus]|nr:P-loop containing nucleoside triphosphate hydrolase protein [Pisolithus croceorrhizus]
MPDERVIVVMGCTGTGKSSFIRNAVPPELSGSVRVGNSLQSETTKVQPIGWVNNDGVKIKLVDTPGFDDSRKGMTDTKVLKMIAGFLEKEYRRTTSRVTGLIYVHRISDTRVGGTPQNNLRIFQKLCGQNSLKNVAIITTMWDMVTADEGQRRERELRSEPNLFKPLLEEGAGMARYDGTRQSASGIIDYLLGKESTTVQIVHELVEEQKPLEETAAGAELRDIINEHLEKYKAELQEKVKCDVEEMKKEMEIERRKAEQEILWLRGQLNDLRKGLEREKPGANDSFPPGYDDVQPGDAGHGGGAPPEPGNPGPPCSPPQRRSVTQCIALLKQVK